MKQSRTNLIRSAEYAGGVFLMLSVFVAGVLGISLVIFVLMGSASAHPTLESERRISENRYLCPTQTELIKQIRDVLHSRKIWRPSDVEYYIHHLVTVYDHCNKNK